MVAATAAGPADAGDAADAAEATASAEAAAAIALTRAWLDRAVIGLNLCPFAKGPQAKGQVRYVLSEARDEDRLLAQLLDEMRQLADAPVERTETTLLIHPWVLQDFLAYNDFLDVAEAALVTLGLEGVLQVASFHPQFQFAGTAPDDIANATNRSPYPLLHLLREASVDRAVAAIPDPEAIFETNIETLTRLGPDGWLALQRQCVDDARQGPEVVDAVASADASSPPGPPGPPHADRLPPPWPSPSPG